MLLTERRQTTARAGVPGRRTAAGRPVDRVLGLQRSAGNRAVTALLQRKTDLRWSGATGINEERTDVGAVRRIPVEGLALGNQKAWRGGASAMLTDESAAGRAIALLPVGLVPTARVRVLVHLHGYAETADRPYAGWRARKDTGEVRDVAHDRIAQQIEAAGDPQVIGILPQGGERSQFGDDYGFQTDAYVGDVLDRLVRGGELAIKPAWSIVLSAHSGGGHTVRNILEADLHQLTGEKVGERQRGKDAAAPPPASLAQVTLFDAINNDRELGTTVAWVTARLNDVLSVVGDGKAPEAAKEKKLAETPRFRAYYASYVGRHAKLKKAIVDWFRVNRPALGPYAERVWAMFQVVPVKDAKTGGLVSHEEVVRGHRLGDKKAPAAGALTDALAARPSVAESLDKALAAKGRRKRGPSTRPAGATTRRRRGPSTLPAGAITSARLGELKTPEETGFRRRVYDVLQQRKLAAGKEYFVGLGKDQKGSVEGHPIHVAAEADARNLLIAARKDWEKDKADKDAKAVACSWIGVNNAYRDPERDFVAWQRAYNKYYKKTADRRGKLPDGPWGDEAVRIVVRALEPNKAVAGFSNHTKGLAIDFGTVHDGVPLGPDHGFDPQWEVSWLYRWLGEHGATFHFTQLPSEMWHWDHAEGASGAKGDAGSGGVGTSTAPGAGASTAPGAGARPDAAAGPVTAPPGTLAAPQEPASGGTRAAVTFGSRARSSAVAGSSLDVLRDVLAAAGLAGATISSTARTATDQARAMYQNLVGRGRGKGVPAQLRLYGPAGDAVIAVFVEHRDRGSTPDVIKAAMRDKIVELGPSTVSRHCGDPATLNVFDVAPSSLGGDAAQVAFVAAARREEGARISRFIPYPDDPGHHFEIRP
jgi:hypothetical protein